MDDSSGFRRPAFVDSPRDASPASLGRPPVTTPGPFGHPNPDPGPAFHTTFTPEVKKNLVWHVQHAYGIVQERFDEALGYDAHTFGYDLYRIGTYWLGHYCDRSAGQLKRAHELKSIRRYCGGPYTLSFYKVGSSATDNIWESFPTSDNGAVTVGTNDEGYPILIGLEDAMVDPIEDLRYGVVAHMGNPTDGLCALYLCIPIKTEGGKIKRWGYAETLYLRSIGASAAPPPPRVGGPPPETPLWPVLPDEEPEADVLVTAR